MTRPLKYDDQFIAILNDKTYARFLYFFEIKVQSTAFFHRLNLQKALIIASFYDMFIGVLSFILLLFEKEKQENRPNAYLISEVILICSLLFGVIGFNSGTTLKKKTIRIYEAWRVFVTFAFILIELLYQFPIINEVVPTVFPPLLLLIPLFMINIYLTRIAWSFFIRLEKGHELLIIHGKYLEILLLEESKIIKNDTKIKYTPPKLVLEPFIEMSPLTVSSNAS